MPVNFSFFYFENVDKTIHSRASKILCSLLRETRLGLGLRQQDLAEQLGEPQSFVSKYESGERRLDTVELYQICLTLNISFAEFIRKFEERIHES